ncbi:hypothetical protein KS4_06520 [Poriferisphaera corsica]|uniref:Uncharacterized protein n=1 Tax=Poriferisphaera corsica TaxID=2528020 RepID=A0A517YQW1_9BACT|nr:hypothetical protein KS4_06520 [Poriferisphaera corsica]
MIEKDRGLVVQCWGKGGVIVRKMGMKWVIGDSWLVAERF